MIGRRAIGGALWTAALALLFAAASAGAAPPTGPRLAVAKVNWNPWRTTLLTVAPDGSRPVRLAGGQQDGPLDKVLIGPLAWRPDGGEVAFSAIREILLVGADGGAVRRLNVADAGDPVYAPDGQTLAFARENEGGPAAIWTIDLASGAQRRLTRPRRGVEYVPSSFSPDGSTLLATLIDRRADTVEAVALQLGSGEVTRLLAHGREPVYSPDGSRIALFREIGKRRNDDLFVLDVATKKLRRLTRTPHKNELFASWDPSGQRIAFSRFRGWRLQWANAIVQINADGTCEREVLAQKRTVFWGAAWQPGPGREAGRIDCGPGGKASSRPASPKPVLRHERAVEAMRNYAREACEERCESWRVSKCRRVGPRYFTCHFVGRLQSEEVCRALLNADLVPFIGGGRGILALGASFSGDSCPSGLFVPPGAKPPAAVRGGGGPGQ